MSPSFDLYVSKLLGFACCANKRQNLNHDVIVSSLSVKNNFQNFSDWFFRQNSTVKKVKIDGIILT